MIREEKLQKTTDKETGITFCLSPAHWTLCSAWTAEILSLPQKPGPEFLVQYHLPQSPSEECFSWDLSHPIQFLLNKNWKLIISKETTYQHIYEPGQTDKGKWLETSFLSNYRQTLKIMQVRLQTIAIKLISQSSESDKFSGLPVHITVYTLL